MTSWMVRKSVNLIRKSQLFRIFAREKKSGGILISVYYSNLYFMGFISYCGSGSLPPISKFGVVTKSDFLKV